MMIDPETRDVVQNVYIRRVQKVGNELVNVPFDTIPMVKDPAGKGGAARSSQVSDQLCPRKTQDFGRGLAGATPRPDVLLAAACSSTASPTGCCCSCSRWGCR